MILASQPETRAALLYLADSADRKQANLELFFERVMDEIFARGLKVGLDRLTGETRLMLLPPREDRRAIEKATHGTPPTQTGEEKNHTPVDQESTTDPENRSRSKRKTNLD
jgi:hypothetical protein